MMKRPQTHLPPLIAAALLAISSPASAENVLLDPGLENGSTSNWLGADIESTVVNTGSYAARMNQVHWWRFSSQTVPCTAGEIVAFGGYMKTENIVQNDAGFRLKFLDSNDQTVESHTAMKVDGTTPYTYYSVEGLLAPAGTVAATMQLFMEKSIIGQYGVAYFDDLFVDTFSHKAVSLLDNGNFENGYTGWTRGHASLVSGSDAYEGTSASAITHGNYWKQSWYNLPCNELQEYAISFAFATEAATSPGLIQLRYYDALGTHIDTDGLVGLEGTNPYALYYTDGIYPPAGAVSMRLLFAAGSPGTGMSYLDDVVLTTDAQGLASPTLIPQAGVEILSNTGFESGTTGWSGGLQIETTNVAAGSQAAKVPGVGFFKWYSYDMTPAVAGEYYSLSAQIAGDNLAYTASLGITFYAADGTTSLGGSDSIADVEGTSPYREYSVHNVRAPAGTAFVRPRIGMPSSNPGGTAFYLDEIHLTEVSTLPVRAVSTYESISVYVGRETQSTAEAAHIYYRELGESEWNEAFEPIFDTSLGEYRVSISGLEENTTYEIQALLEANDTVLDEAGTTVDTWSSTPTIAQTINLSTLYASGQLVIESMHGEPDAWIKIVGTGDNDIDGTYANDVALAIRNSSYLIFENIEVKGGRLHGVEIDKSNNIRVINCEISGWAREANYTDGKLSYETQADLNAGRAINQDAAIHLYKTTQVTVERCYMHDPRLSSNDWSGGHPEGPNAILVESDSLSGNTVVRYNDMIGSDEIRWNDAIEGHNNGGLTGSFHRDSDIYGNMLAFGNDDGIELDGGQINLRFFGNRVEQFYVGISLAPNRAGPCYVYRNFVLNLGDAKGNRWSMVKNGGGTTYSQGKSFFFNNTMYSSGNGLAGVGFGSDSNRRMFLGMSRNNIFYSLSTSHDYSRAIYDSAPNAWNDFDYDNLASAGRSSALVDYAAGQEANGILDDSPSFVDAAAGDFRLASGSSGIDDGTPLLNFADIYTGASPDQGALEEGDSSLMPIRPIAISSDKYIVALNGTANGSTTPVTVTLTTGDLGGSLNYEVLMNNTVDWLSASPATGTLNSNSTHTITLTLLTAGLSSGDDLRATILIKLANGHSVPITVNADVN